MHGGIIEAESAGPGRGSRFVVTLPLTKPPERDTPSPRGSGAEAHRILIVEDNPDTLESLETFLRLSGHEAAGVSEGALAVGKANRFRPTVALVDLGLPDVNGYDVARGLRAEPALAGLHLVAVTGWAQEEDKQRSLGAGFDHHLVKPVEPEALLRLLASLPAIVRPPD
jgi:DNA-binding response OmpR family regulator